MRRPRWRGKAKRVRTASVIEAGGASSSPTSSPDPDHLLPFLCPPYARVFADSASDVVLSSDGEMAESDDDEVDYEEMVASKVVEKKVCGLTRPAAWLPRLPRADSRLSLCVQ